MTDISMHRPGETKVRPPRSHLIPPRSQRHVFALLLIAFTGPAPLLLAQDTPQLRSTRPNVLVIITDDQGYGDLSLHGNPYVNTPHIDRLGRTGVQFERFYVNSFCAPTRAALLTGRWPLRCGVHGVTHNKEAMRPSEMTFAEAFQQAGYHTACIGKWHNGEQYPFTPQGQGFEEFFGFHNGHWNNYFNTELLRGSEYVQTSGYITDVLTDAAIAFIRDQQSAPFLCYLPYNAPHSPYQVPDRYFDRFKQQGLDDEVAAYWGMCENIDDNVGRLLTMLEDAKLADNTLVLFLTDNGGTAGVKIYNAGMRGGKTSVHEGGTRVPLFMKWPAAHWTPHVAKPLTSHIDIYPTLLDLCQVAPPHGPAVDGVSLRPLLEGDGTDWPERVLFTHNPIDEKNKYPGAVRTERYRLVREVRGPGGGSRAQSRDETATPWQLYDMLQDPGEENDIADREPERVAQLSALYDRWFNDISRDGLQRFPIPVGYSEENPVEIHAPQAYFTNPLTFASGPGWANDWLTGWTSAEGKLWFELDVVSAGIYEVEIAYACEVAHAGSLCQLSAGQGSLEFQVPAAAPQPVSLPNRDERGMERYRNRNWATLKPGMLNLPAGPTTLSLEVLRQGAGEVLDFKHIRLKKQD